MRQEGRWGCLCTNFAFMQARRERRCDFVRARDPFHLDASPQISQNPSGQRHPPSCSIPAMPVILALLAAVNLYVGVAHNSIFHAIAGGVLLGILLEWACS